MEKWLGVITALQAGNGIPTNKAPKSGRKTGRAQKRVEMQVSGRQRGSSGLCLGEWTQETDCPVFKS